MNYRVTKGEYQGEIVHPFESIEGKNFVKVRLVHDSRSNKCKHADPDLEFPIQTNFLEPIYVAGSIVSIPDVPEASYEIISIEPGWVFLHPTQFEFGDGVFKFPILKIKPAE